MRVCFRNLDPVTLHLDLCEGDPQLRLAGVANSPGLTDLALGRSAGTPELKFPLQLEIRFVAARLRRLRLRLRRFSLGLRQSHADLGPMQCGSLHLGKRRTAT